MNPMRRAVLFATAILLAAPAASAATAGDVASGMPLDLASAIRTTLANNQTIKVQAYYPRIDQANLLNAYGAFDPALTFNRSYAVENEPTLALGGPIVPSQIKTDYYSLGLTGLMPWGLTYNVGGNATNTRGTDYAFNNDYITFGGVNLTQPLLRGFGLAANLVNVRVARANHSIDEWNFRLILIQTVTNVITDYNALVLAHKELETEVHGRDLAETLLRQNIEEVKIGYMARSEVTTARAQVAAYDGPIVTAQYNVRAADNALWQLMGETSFPPTRAPLVVSRPDVPDVTIDAEKDLQEALNKNPEYQAARLGIKINRAKLAAARNGLLPQVNLIASYGYNGNDQDFAASRRQVWSEKYPSSAIEASVSVPIFNASARGTARAARLTEEQSEENLGLLEGTIALAVANAAANIDATRKEVSAYRVAYDLANTAMEDEEKKLRDGTSTTLAVQQAQQSLISVETSLAAAMAAASNAVAYYDEDIGRTLDRYHIDVAGR